jgi:hypothetical protein
MQVPLGVIGMIFSYQYGLQAILNYKKRQVDHISSEIKTHKAFLKTIEDMKKIDSSPEEMNKINKFIQFSNTRPKINVGNEDVSVEEAQKLLELKEQNLKTWQNFSTTNIAAKLFSTNS